MNTSNEQLCDSKKDKQSQEKIQDLRTLTTVLQTTPEFEESFAGFEDFMVVTGNNAPPSGYSKHSIDLNEGAGGEYIYFCSKGSNPGQIRDIYVAVGDTPDVSVPSGYTKINVDLNQGAGGKYIYLCFTKGGSEQVIRGIGLISSDDSNPSPSTGYVRYPVDLNQGAGGKYIYFQYRR